MIEAESERLEPTERAAETRFAFRPPIVLLAGAEPEWIQMLASVLAVDQVEVVQARTRSEVIEAVHRLRPELMILQDTLTDASGLTVCRELRQVSWIRFGLPILIASTSSVSGDFRIRALREGAWDCIILPLHPEEVCLRIGHYLQAAQELLQARADTLLDPSGVYNLHGLLRRVHEVGVVAIRKRRALACTVVGWEATPSWSENWIQEEAHQEALARTAVQAITSVVRTSDVVARASPTEFVLVVSECPDALTEQLVERVMDAVETRLHGFNTITRSLPMLSGGWYAVRDLKPSGLQPVEVFVRAAIAFREACRERRHRAVRRYAEDSEPQPWEAEPLR